MTTYSWPVQLVPANADIFTMPYNTSGGVAFDASEQVIGNSPGRTRLVLRNIFLSNREQILLWRRIAARVQGRANALLMPIYEYLRSPVPKPAAPTRHSDGTGFGDGSAYDQPTVSALAKSHVAAGTTRISIAIVGINKLQDGQWFGHPATQRVYCIRGIVSQTSVGKGIVAVVDFWPPARNTIFFGTAIELANPLMRCRLDSDDAMALADGLELWRRAAANLTLWEDI